MLGVIPRKAKVRSLGCSEVSGRHTDTQTGRHTDRQTHRHTDIQEDRHTDKDRQTDTCK